MWAVIFAVNEHLTISMKIVHSSIRTWPALKEFSLHNKETHLTLKVKPMQLYTLPPRQVKNSQNHEDN
jgi:hypothetical protein